ncbi:MAG TPA: hypothetical protein VN879_16035 [Candidatus Acidoferrales bacterium]|nr:hypothetical protein [Candidatus Acidoferrales bacterium]
METIDKVEKAHYLADEHDVELLAVNYRACSEGAKRVDGAYLRILIASLQAKFPGKRKLKDTDLHSHSEYVHEIHTTYYHAVLRGVTSDDVKDDELLSVDERRARAGVRNGRANFARSAASTLQSYIKAGGDVRSLSVLTVTKTALRTFALAKQPEAPKMELVMAALSKVEKRVMTWVDEDPDQARAAVEECMARLQHILDDLPQHERRKKAA